MFGIGGGYPDATTYPAGMPALVAADCNVPSSSNCWRAAPTASARPVWSAGSLDFHPFAAQSVRCDRQRALCAVHNSAQ